MVDPILENVTLEPELEEALASATDAELCDIAGKTTHTHTHTSIHISSQKAIFRLVDLTDQGHFYLIHIPCTKDMGLVFVFFMFNININL